MIQDFVLTPAGEVRVGDWIRFMSGGRLIVAQVEYILARNSSNPTGPYICTTDGMVYDEAVKEIRRKS